MMGMKRALILDVEFGSHSTFDKKLNFEFQDPKHKKCIFLAFTAT
jgi:hypothetical protein